MRSALPLMIGLVVALAACGEDAVAPSSPATEAPQEDVSTTPDSGRPPAQDVADAVQGPPPPEPFVVVTFNTGTGLELAHDAEPDDGYSMAHAEITDEHYGNGLSFTPFVEATRAWFEAQQPDIVAFQEIFWPGECAAIPEDAQEGFVCEAWAEGDPTVAEMVLGDGYQIACHPQKPDKCAAVRTAFGSFRDCEAPVCLDGLVGFAAADCGKGARIARGVIDRVDGGPPITLVSVHGSSGLTEKEFACRSAQIEQVFVDLGDGEPGANGTHNLILGDFNTDPARLAESDSSAALWSQYTAESEPFHFVTELGLEVTPTYGGIFNIDHVVSDAFDGSCWSAGVTEGHPAVMDAVFFDHVPVVCDVHDPGR